MVRRGAVVHGPSPRVRGKPYISIGKAEEYGSIPACAGETPPAPPRACPVTVHPRVCGGNSSSAVMSGL